MPVITRIGLLLLAALWSGGLVEPANADPRRISVESCAACHGAEGIAPDVAVPHLAGQNEVYLFNQLMAFRSGQRRHREMRYMARELTREDMAALAAYYAALPRQ
jgi:cytochrome c553